MSTHNTASVANAPQYDGPTMQPPVDVVEDRTRITLYADMPGVPKDRLTVRVEADTLTIEGEVSLPMPANVEASHAEVHLARYQRTFTLGQELDRDKVDAQFRHGVLTLTIPKAEYAKPRRIEVRAG